MEKLVNVGLYWRLQDCFDFSSPVTVAPLPSILDGKGEDEVKKTPGIHYAKLENSPRLQRLYSLLKGGMEFTTLEIIRQANICAVNSAISELRRNGYDIGCKVVGRGIYAYKMEAHRRRGAQYES